uniref:CUB domain-containing protein n=1 Tax=Ciona savignyi TaxID=51511 RepID=H2ZK45_CIOSA
MKFKTDGSITHSGFNVRYSISGSYFPSSGTISSPSYPANYHNNAENNYVIKPPGATRIRLDFTSFILEGSEPSCRYDSVTIKRGTKYGTQLDKFCGTKSSFTRTYTASQLTLMFKTDRSVVRSGFRCVYSRYN